MSKVSRSEYQKVCEENKRLLKDIIILVDNQIPPSAEQILTINKWRTKFKEEREFHERMREAVKQYIKDHKDELPEFLTNSLKNEQD